MTTPATPADDWPVEETPDEYVDLEAAAEDARAVQLEPGPDDEVTQVNTGDRPTSPEGQ